MLSSANALREAQSFQKLQITCPHTTECYETDSARYSNPTDDAHSLFPVNKLMAAPLNKSVSVLYPMSMRNRCKEKEFLVRKHLKCSHVKALHSCNTTIAGFD